MAISALESGGPVDLVFSDIAMPGMSGVDLARWIRAHRPTLRVILTSGYSEQSAAALREGFSVIPQPYSFRALTAALDLGAMRSGD
jgi:two-component system NtrC family sensor kinase